MKAKSKLTTLLCGVLSITTLFAGAALSRTKTASAAAKTHYPEVFKGFVNDDMQNITDFATDGETFVFSDRTCIMEISGGERVKYDIPYSSAIDCDGETFYYRQGGQAYTLHGDEPVDYTFRTEFPSPSDGDYKIATVANEIAVYYCAKESLTFEKVVGTEGVTRIKTYDNTVYALLPSGVYKLDRLASPESVNPSYTDFSGTKTVAVGSAIDDLKSYSLEKPHMAMLEPGSFFTELTLNNLLGAEYFTVGETYTEASGVLPFDEPVLILCKTGNAAIFTYGGNTYMTLAQNCVEVKFDLSETDFSKAIVSVTDFAYCAPCVGETLKSFPLTSGTVVKVLGKTEKTTAVGNEFYLIEYETDGGTATGYALGGMLIAYYGEEDPSNPDDKNYGQITDGNYSENDLIKVVILVIVIILLVLIALGYIVYVATGKKKNKEQ